MGEAESHGREGDSRGREGARDSRALCELEGGHRKKLFRATVGWR